MKKIFSSLLMLVAFTAFAQTPAAQKAGRRQQTPEQRATAMASHLETSLGLSADQKVKVHDLALAREQKMQSLREQNKDKDRCAWADQRKQAQETFDSGMKQILTPEQLTKWNEQKAEHKKQMETRRSQHATNNKTPEQRADGIAGHLEKELGLSADQKTKVHDLALSKEQSMDKLRESHQGQDPCSWKDERKKVQETFESGMKTTLTPDQFQKWETLKKQRMDNRKNQPHPQKQGK